MKNLKFIYLSILLVFFTLASCDNNDPVIDVQNPNQSASAKTSMLELQSHFNTDGSLRDGNNPTNDIIFDYCFNFQLPVTLSYNTGVTVTINEFRDLVGVLINMTDDLYIDGIVFPFNVEVYNDNTDSIVVQTINNETDFETLVDSCGFDEDDCICTDEYAPVCVEISANGQGHIVQFTNACEAMCDGFTQADFVDCDNTHPGNEGNGCFEYNFPISLIGRDGVTVVANDAIEFYNILYGAANYYDFVYPFDVTIIDGGAVQTIANVTDFSTLIVACNGNVTCDVVFPAPLGESVQEFCVNDGPFTLADLVVENTTGYNSILWFDGIQSDGANQLPMTSSLANGTTYYAYQAIGDCVEALAVTFYIESCNTSPCWEFVYPATFSTGGGTQVANSDTEVIAILGNNQQAEVMLPFNVTVNGVAQTITTYAEYEAIGFMANWCRS